MVLPEEAAIVSLAQKVGRVSVSLRRPDSLALPKPAPVTVKDLLEGKRAEAARQQRYKTIQKIKIVRGLPGVGSRVVMPPRTSQSVTTVMCLGARRSTRSSRMRLVTASW